MDLTALMPIINNLFNNNKNLQNNFENNNSNLNNT